MVQSLREARLEHVASLERALCSATLLLSGRRGVDAAILRLRVASARSEAEELRQALRQAAKALR